jgi:protein ImuB
VPVSEGTQPFPLGWRPGTPRPLRLLARPELLETVAPVAGGERAEEEPPAAFLWRRVQHRLRAVEGPERISPEWWRPENNWAGGARDYWRVEDETGRRFWLFREAKPRRDGAPRWFLHGLFA